MTITKVVQLLVISFFFLFTLIRYIGFSHHVCAVHLESLTFLSIIILTHLLSRSVPLRSRLPCLFYRSRKRVSILTMITATCSFCILRIRIHRFSFVAAYYHVTVWRNIYFLHLSVLTHVHPDIVI